MVVFDSKLTLLPFAKSFYIHTGKNEATSYRKFGLGGEVHLEFKKVAGVPPLNELFENEIFFEYYFTSAKFLRFLADEDFCASGMIRQSRVDD